MAEQDPLINQFNQGKPPTNEENRKELNEINEEVYLKSVKEQNKRFLIRLSALEKERIAAKLAGFYEDALPKHKELEDKIDAWNETWRMERRQVRGTDGDTPNYQTPLSTVTAEVVHANIMNVFFTPTKVMNVLPTEAGDVAKIKKLDTFGNWSMNNEMNIFDECDRLFHQSTKYGESPYIVDWHKEYGVEIKREPLLSPVDNTPLIDEDTQEPIFQERDVPKILYNGPRLSSFSRKDLILPLNAMRNRRPWEMRRVRMTSDETLRKEKEGKFFTGVSEKIDWGSSSENTAVDNEGDEIKLGKNEKVFIEFYGRLQINEMKSSDTEELNFKELEDEFIAIFEPESQELCAIRKNKFPLKMRPIGIDELIPDDEGRQNALGVMPFMEANQTAYDAFFNQFAWGTIQANNPTIFFTPFGNMKKEPIKLKSGYAYPTADPKSVITIKIPPPDLSLRNMMDEVKTWAQLLFGVSNFSAGVESSVDPTGPAKKAELIVAQGNVRLNLIIKRKNKTLKDIFKRWFLLYSENMPPNKFMRIAGEDRETPWQFKKMNLEDFALKSIPDFELTGNVLNANKTLAARKASVVFQLLSQNFFFQPQTTQGLQALHSLTKWFLDQLDETGISNFLPVLPEGENVSTPEEENARFMQGDTGEPAPNEDHIDHIRKHNLLLADPTVPENIRQNVFDHIQLHNKALQTVIASQLAVQQGGGLNVGGETGQGQNVQPGQGTPNQPGRVAGFEELAGMGKGSEQGII